MGDPRGCRQGEGCTGIDCALPDAHQGDHEGSTTVMQTEYVGYPLFVRWPRDRTDTCNPAEDVFRQANEELDKLRTERDEAREQRDMAIAGEEFAAKHLEPWKRQVEELRAERDELRAHGVARDIGEANDRTLAGCLAHGVHPHGGHECDECQECTQGPVAPATPTEPRKPWPSPMWHEQPCKTCGCDACDHDPTAEPVTPTEPRVWRQADPEPAGVSKVRDCMGDIWTLQPFGVWEAPDTRPASWNYMVKKWAPLTEVVDGAPAEDKP